MRTFTMSSPLIAIIVAAIASAFVPNAYAQRYPDKPVRLIVGFPPGGATDLVARVVGKKLSEDLGQQFIVDDRPGAGSAIASNIAAKSPADGYTLVMVATSHAVNAGFDKKLPYDPVRDYAAVSLVASAPLIIVSSPSLPIKTVADLIELARAQPGRINYASGGTGSISHLAGELLKRMANIELVHVPYKGAGQSLPDVISGQMQLLLSSLPAVLSQVKAGRVKAIAVTSSKRSQSAPEIATVAESGLPGYEAVSWNGLLAPTGTSVDIVNKLNVVVRHALANTDTVNALVQQGCDPMASSPREFAAYLKSEIAKWTRVVREAHITSD